MDLDDHDRLVTHREIGDLNTPHVGRIERCTMDIVVHSLITPAPDDAAIVGNPDKDEPALGVAHGHQRCLQWPAPDAGLELDSLMLPSHEPAELRD